MSYFLFYAFCHSEENKKVFVNTGKSQTDQSLVGKGGFFFFFFNFSSPRDLFYVTCEKDQ